MVAETVQDLAAHGEGTCHACSAERWVPVIATVCLSVSSCRACSCLVADFWVLQKAVDGLADSVFTVFYLLLPMVWSVVLECTFYAS